MTATRRVIRNTLIIPNTGSTTTIAMITKEATPALRRDGTRTHPGATVTPRADLIAVTPGTAGTRRTTAGKATDTAINHHPVTGTRGTIDETRTIERLHRRNRFPREDP